jgi:hypothetical protein
MKSAFIAFFLIFTLLVLAPIFTEHARLPLQSKSTSSKTASTGEKVSGNSGTGVSNVAVIVSSTMNLNALNATNLDQWKEVIPGLRYSDNLGRWSSWVMEQTNRLTGIPVSLDENGKTISYRVRFVNIGVYNNEGGKIMEVEMHSPMMNIDETRSLGLQLCQMLELDSSGFSEWCDKVGNHWPDSPLFSTASNAHLSFRILNTFNNDTPWYINFVIQN